MWKIFLLPAILILLNFCLKLGCIHQATRLLRPYFPDVLASALVAWVMMTALTFAAMMLLSAFGALTPIPLWLFFIASYVLLAAAARHVQAKSIDYGLELGLPASLILIGGACILVFLLRGLLLSDLTADAMRYNMVRIALWANYGSIFVHMPTTQFNLFSNEWNGELIGLAYGVAAKNIQGFIFGNVEVLLFTLLGFAWFSERLGMSRLRAFSLSALMISTPAVLGLTATVKGDLLACTGMLIAAGCITLLDDEDFWPQASSMAITALALSFGAKISAVVAAVLLGAYVLFKVAKHYRDVRLYVSMGTAFLLSLIFLNRFIVNQFVYGNAFKRADREEPTAGIGNFFENLTIFVRRTLDFFAGGDGYEIRALGGGLGIAGVLIVCALPIALSMRAPGPRSRTALLLAAFAVAATMIGFIVIPARGWMFRYFLPGTLIIAACTFALMPQTERLDKVVKVVALAAILLHLSRAMTISQIVPDVNALLKGQEGRSILEMSSLERTFLSHRTILTSYGGMSLDRKNPFTIAYLSKGKSLPLPYIGSRFQNRLLLRTEWSDIPENANVIVAAGYFKNLDPGRKEEVRSRGFEWCVQNKDVSVAVKGGCYPWF